MRRLSRVLTGVKVETRHILNRETGEPEKRTHKIKEVTRFTAASEESEFVLPDGRRVTVAQYFAVRPCPRARGSFTARSRFLALRSPGRSDRKSVALCPSSAVV